MLDKKRLAIIIAIAAVVIVALVIGIVWIATNATRSDAEPTPSPSATSSAGADTSGFTPELKSAVITAAATAAQFQGSDTKAQRERNYLKAGFTQELATNFEPVWFEVFSDPIVGKVHIESTGETLVSAAVSIQARDVTVESAKGAPGSRIFRVAVDVDCQPQWTTETGNPRMPSKFTATWRVTIDEATGQITDVTQPTADEIPFRPES